MLIITSVGDIYHFHIPVYDSTFVRESNISKQKWRFKGICLFRCHVKLTHQMNKSCKEFHLHTRKQTLSSMSWGSISPSFSEWHHDSEVLFSPQNWSNHWRHSSAHSHILMNWFSAKQKQKKTKKGNITMKENWVRPDQIHLILTNIISFWPSTSGICAISSA